MKKVGKLMGFIGKLMGYIVVVFVILFINFMIKQIFFKENVATSDLLNNYYSRETVENALELIKKDQADLTSDEYIHKLLELINESESEELKFYNKLYTKEEYDVLMNKAKAKRPNSEFYAELNYSYLKIGSFRDTGYIDLLKVNTDKINNSEYFIIDIRNNSGGLIENYEAFMEFFCEENESILKLKENSIVKESVANEAATIRLDKVVILINEKTASVSELLTLNFNLKYENCVVIGKRTYGKYFAYGVKTFIDDSKLMFVTSIMMDSNETIIPINGIDPEIELAEDKLLDKYDYLQHVIELANNYVND